MEEDAQEAARLARRDALRAQYRKQRMGAEQAARPSRQHQQQQQQHQQQRGRGVTRSKSKRHVKRVRHQRSQSPPRSLSPQSHRASPPPIMSIDGPVILAPATERAKARPRLFSPLAAPSTRADEFGSLATIDDTGFTEAELRVMHSRDLSQHHIPVHKVRPKGGQPNQTNA